MDRVRPRTLILPLIFLSAVCLFALSKFTLHSSPFISEQISNHDHTGKSPREIQKISNRYPTSVTQWEEQIVSAAQGYDLDPNLIAAVMLQESGGQPEVISTSGAVGLMQIMPRDGIAKWFMCNGYPCFANRPSTTELFDPDFNIDFSARMLSNLINMKISIRDALKSYGPMDVGFMYADKVLSIYAAYK